jgi:cell division protein ZapE
LLEQYQELLRQKVLCLDEAQHAAIIALDKLSKELELVSNHNIPCNPPLITNTYLAKLLPKLLSKKTKPIHESLYFYGRVGRGKTMLMDMFYQSISIKHKKRIHFHRFMESVHQQLDMISLHQSSIANHSGESPLARIAKVWASDITLLCFDEFFVSDIGDAMLLSGLFKELFSLGVTLVITSNCQPEELYCNGLQRERFLPTIDLINQYCQIISVNGELDHRLANTVSQRYKNYYFTHSQGEELLSERFREFDDNSSKSANENILKNIIVNNRRINYLAKTDKQIWFDFFSLCSGPRSQRDYIQIADQFETVLLSNVPQFSGKPIPAVFSGVEDSYQRNGVLMADLQHLDDEARRFIALVDEFYDRKVKLIISAEVDIADLYQGQQLSFEFQRCQSRLFEMQNI